MFRRQLLFAGLVVLLCFFGAVNSWPYLSANSKSERVHLELIDITHENGTSLDLSSRTASSSRKMARQLVKVLGVGSEVEDEYQESYIAEVRLLNDDRSDLFLLEANYILRIDGHNAAFGHYERAQALTLPAGGSANAYLPFTLELSLDRFTNLVEKNVYGEIVGDVWLQRGSKKIKVSYNKVQSLSHFILQ